MFNQATIAEDQEFIRCIKPRKFGHDVSHSRPQRPRSFWSAPRIATSGQLPFSSPEPTILLACGRDRENRRLPVLDQARAQSLPQARRIVGSGDENENGPEVAILGADQKERGLWGREWTSAYERPS